MSLSGTRGVFSLRQIYNNQRRGTGYPIADVFTQRPEAALPDIGYNTGGWQSGTQRSNTDKLTFSNDTWAAAPSADLSVARTEGQAAGNASFGYIVGGLPPSTNVDRITYSSDTGAAVPGAFLPNPGLHRAGSNGSNDNGYFSGGNAPGLSVFTNTYKLVYASETSSRIPGMDLTAARQYCVGAGNADIGFILGQSPGPTSISNTIKQTFSTETCSNTPSSGDLSGVKYRPGGFGDTTHAYFAGGNPGLLSTVDRIQISNDTRSTLPSTGSLEEGRNSQSTQGSNSLAYNTGGFSSPGANTNSDKLVYSTETMSRLSGGITAARYRSMGVGPKEKGKNQNQSFPTQQFTTGVEQGANTGYYAGGRVPGPNPSDVSTVGKIDLATETVSNGGDLAVATDEGGVASSTTHGYIVGGRSGTPYISSCNKYTFSSDTGANVPGGELTSARYGVMGAGNQDFAFFTGGSTPTNVTTTEKLTYSSDTTAAAPGSLMPTPGRRAGSKMGNQNAGYFAGNSGGGTQCSKLTYSNESHVNVPSANLIAGRYLLSSTGTDTSGYVSGGFPSKSSTEKITWATDTCQNLPGAPLSSTRYGQTGTGNNDVGYVAGGSGVVSTIDKIDFNTDTSSTTSSYLTTARRYSNGIGPRRDGNPQAPLPTPTAQTFPVPQPDAAPPITGYVTTGESPAGNLSSSVKLNMSTDAFSSVPSMNLPSAAGPSGYRTYAASASSPTHGYLMGGYAPNFSNATKTTYVTETIAVIPGSTSEARRSVAQGGGNSSRGYMAGGYSEAQSPNRQVSNVDKLLYSTDTFGRQPGANLTEQRGGAGSVSNQSRMLTICGNNGPASRSIVDRIDFASDTTDRIPGANDPQARQYCRSTYYPSPERGYSSGGRDSPSNTWYSLTTRFNFSDDTSSSVPGGNLSSARKDHMAIGNTTDGYQTGGNFPGGGGPNVAQSTTEKLNMSTETYAAAPSANLDIARQVGSGFAPYMNGNPSANVPQAPIPAPNNC